MPLRWEMFVNLYDRENRHLAFVREFASVVSVLQDKTNAAIDTSRDVDRLVEELATCTYSTAAFAPIIKQIQAIVRASAPPPSLPALGAVPKLTRLAPPSAPQVDRLNLEGYANLDAWVLQLDARVEKVLLDRIAQIIRQWSAQFTRNDDQDDWSARRKVGFAADSALVRFSAAADPAMVARLTPDRSFARPPQRDDGVVEVISLLHEVRIQNQVIYLDPPIEHARASWMQQLQAWLGASRRCPSAT